MNNHKIKRNAVKGLKYLSLCVFSFLALLPLYTVLITAFKTEEEYRTGNIMALPHHWHFENFVEAFKFANMGKAFLYSTIILVSVLVITTILGTQMGYVLSRFKNRANTWTRNLFLFCALIPGIAMQISVYQIMYKLHLINSLIGYIILMAGIGVVEVTIYVQYFDSIDIALDESAILDGASYFRTFYSILLPMVRPAMVTTCILKGVATYNEFYLASLYLQDTHKYVTVPTSLYSFVGPYSAKYTLICAGVVISAIPALVLFVLCQKQIYSGIAAGAVKG